MKAALRNDWSVAMLWRMVENRFYLEHIWRRRVKFPELQHTIMEIARTAQPNTILIEDKGSGTGLIQTLRDDPDGFPVKAYDPGQVDKENRMRIQSLKIENGLVFLPPEAPWLEESLNEVRRFPNGALTTTSRRWPKRSIMPAARQAHRYSVISLHPRAAG